MELSKRREAQLYSDNLTDFCKDNQLYLELLKDHVDELEKMKLYDASIKQSKTDGDIHRLAKSSDPRNMAVMFTRMDPNGDGRLFKAAARTGEFEDSLTERSKFEENPFCYLCSTIEQHRRHLQKTQKKIHGKKRIPYEAPAPFVPPKPPPPKPESKECLYRVTIKTGTDIKAACSVPVYITLHGEKGTLSRARLTKKFGSLAFFFDSGSTEVFHLRGPKIGRLTDMTLAMETAEEAAAAATTSVTSASQSKSIQSNPGKQRHRWLLESVSVRDYAMELEYHFNIDSWLRAGRRDRVRLPPTATARSLAHSGRGILVTTYTGRKATSGTDCRVYISLLGASGARGRHELRRPVEEGGASRGIFQPGGKDVFELYVEDFGDLKGIKLELDTHNVRSSGKSRTDSDRTQESSRTWFVDQVIVKDIKTGQKWLFTISEWLNEDAPTKEFWTVKDINDRMGAVYSQTTLYQIVTKTGKKDFAGTDSTIYLALFDKDSRRCDIELRDEDKSRFEKGKTDTMTETARVIDTPVRLKVSISGTGVAPDWFVDGIVVTKYLVMDEILQYLQRLQFSNKMPEGLTQDKGKILFEATEVREKQRKKLEGRKKSRDDGEGGKKQKKGRDRSSSKDHVDDGIGVFGHSRRQASLKSSKQSSSEDDDDSVNSDAANSDSNDSVKSHDDFDPEHGSVRLPYAVQVSFAPRSKEDAWLKKDKTVELKASDAGKMLYRQLRLRSDNESFERIRQELLEKQRSEEEKKKKQQEKKRMKMQEQQKQKRAAARKSGSRSKSSRDRTRSSDSSSSASSSDADRKRRPLNKSPAPMDKKKPPLSRSSRMNSDSDSSVDAFGKPKHSKRASADKKQPLEKRTGSVPEAKRTTRAAEDPDRNRFRTESDRARESLPLEKDQKRSPRDVYSGRSRTDFDFDSPLNRDRGIGRPDLDKAADKKLLPQKGTSGSLDARRAAKTPDDFDRSKERSSLDQNRGRDRLEFEKDKKRSPRDVDRSLGREDFDKGPDRRPLDLERGRGRLDTDKGRGNLSLDRRQDRSQDLDKGLGSTDFDKGRERSPRDANRNPDRFDLDRDRQARLDRTDRDRDLDTSRSGRLDRSDLSRGRTGLDLDRGQDRSDLSRGRTGLDLDRGRSGLDLDRGQDRSDLSRGRTGLDLDRGRNGLDLDRGQHRSDLSRGRTGLDLDRGQDRSDLSRGRTGLDLDRGQDRSDLSRGRSGLGMGRDRDRLDLDKGRDRRGGALAAASHDNPRIVVTATDGRQDDPVVARGSGRVRQRSFNLD